MSNKTPSLVDNCVDDLFKAFFNLVDGELVLTDDVDPSIISIIDRYSYKQCKVTYEMRDSSCPRCGLEMSKNGSVKFNLNKCRIIYKQKYICPDEYCKYTMLVDLSEFIDPGSNYTKRFKHMVLEIKEIGYLSYEKIAEIIELFTGIVIPRSTIFYHENILSNDYFDKRMNELNKMVEKLGITPSGVFHYDEQYLWVNTEFKMRMTILDANTKLIIC